MDSKAPISPGASHHSCNFMNHWLSLHTPFPVFPFWSENDKKRRNERKKKTQSRGYPTSLQSQDVIIFQTGYTLIFGKEILDSSFI